MIEVGDLVCHKHDKHAKIGILIYFCFNSNFTECYVWWLIHNYSQQDKFRHFTKNLRKINL